MSGTYTSERSGDWGTAAIWKSGSIPQKPNAEVTIDTDVSIGSGETFLVGLVAVQPNASLSVAGDLGIATGLTLEAGLIGGLVELFGGSLSAGTIDIEPSLGIQGWGTITSPGSLANDGVIYSGGGPGQTLTLTPASYTQAGSVQSGELAAIDSVLDLAPTTGASGFADLANGTLTGGTYAAENGGILELPGPITNIESTSLLLDEAVPTFGAPEIVTGGTAIEASLTEVGIGATLSLDNYDYVSERTLDVRGVVSLNERATLSTAGLDVGGELLGVGTIRSNIENNGEIVARTISGENNLMVLSGSIGGAGHLVVGGNAILELVQGTTQSVQFEATTSAAGFPGVLRLDMPGSYSGTIAGFGLVDVNGTAYGNAIDLPNFAPGFLSDVYEGTTTAGTLKIAEPGGIVASLTFIGDYLNDTFHLFSDGHGGTDIALAELTHVPCFARGTHIATPAGDIAIEDLRAGDHVLTASGQSRPIVWIGKRRVDCARHPRPELVRPVRVRAGAFGTAPRSDLLLSPDHSIYAEGALIPIKYLLNGATVVQELSAEAHYFHVELDRHDVLLAEGLTAESYLDTCNRAQFENGDAPAPIHADFSALTWEQACAPLCLEGERVLAVRRLLLARIADLGWTRGAPPELRLLVGQRAIRPVEVKGKLHRFFLPAGTREVRLVSSAIVPAGLDLAHTDCRTLGARIDAVFINRELLPLDSPNFASGFHPVESNKTELWRWTDGRARLILPAVVHALPIMLELQVREVMAGWKRSQAVSELSRAI